MTTTSIHLAETDADFDAARTLCHTWVDWQLKTFPELKTAILKYFEPVAYGRIVDELHNIHARPKGGILLASLDGNPVGCVMFVEMEPGIAEIKRLFVDEAGRGHGLGAALLTAMFKQMRTDGYSAVRFESANFLSHALQLYEKVGFTEIPPPAGFPEYLKDIAYFMERPL